MAFADSLVAALYPRGHGAPAFSPHVHPRCLLTNIRLDQLFGVFFSPKREKLGRSWLRLPLPPPPTPIGRWRSEGSGTFWPPSSFFVFHAMLQVGAGGGGGWRFGRSVGNLSRQNFMDFFLFFFFECYFYEKKKKIQL